MAMQLVYNLPLRSQTRNALLKAYIHSVEELRTMSRKQLLVVGGIGPRGLAHIQECLSAQGSLDEYGDRGFTRHEEASLCA